MGTYNLSDAEYEIMDFLWAQKETSTLQDIIAYCTNEKNHTWKQQTIYTFLTRLELKGAVTAVKRGHKRYYSASMSRIEFKKRATHQLLEESFDGSLKNFLIAFTGGCAMDEEDKNILREFLNDSNM
jgi:BlaI family penicillinase repressor